jgi:hypothetical protein
MFALSTVADTLVKAVEAQPIINTVRKRIPIFFVFI